MTLVIGVGNRWRRDDGAGLEVARQLEAHAGPGLRVLVREGDQAGLIDDWRDAEEVVIVDSAWSSCSPGTIHRHDGVGGPLPVPLSRTSTHAFGVAEAIELARALDRLPTTVVVYAIEGERFEAGAGLSPAVRGAVDQLAGDLLLSGPADRTSSEAP